MNSVISVVNMQIDAGEEVWPLDKPFRISRGSRTETRVVVVTVSGGQHSGRGEGVPIKRYNQTPASVLAEIESIKSAPSLDRDQLQKLLPPGAARNAVDCALWDLKAKISGKRVWELPEFAKVYCSRRPVGDAHGSRSEAATDRGFDRTQVETAFTISLDTPDTMATAAKAAAHLPILKLKLGGDTADLARVQAVHEAAPEARLLVDANESWTAKHYRETVPSLVESGVKLIEQPFPATSDDVLKSLDHPIPVCADESCHTTADLAKLKNRYEVVNIKLDKTGGLTEALHLAEQARQAGFKLLIGCMVCTSLGIAPARLLAGSANWVDLDGALLLARDREHGLLYENGKISLPLSQLWG
jgi:L-alanine-DL-glutamate epimerase-like enolase superfamily enzyme